MSALACDVPRGDPGALASKQALLGRPGQVADLSMGDLLLHCTVAWINPPASLVKSKKEPHLAAFGEDRWSVGRHDVAVCKKGLAAILSYRHY